jgi:hypothetical protein
LAQFQPFILRSANVIKAHAFGPFSALDFPHTKTAFGPFDGFGPVFFLRIRVLALPFGPFGPSYSVCDRYSSFL